MRASVRKLLVGRHNGSAYVALFILGLLAEDSQLSYLLLVIRDPVCQVNTTLTTSYMLEQVSIATHHRTLNERRVERCKLETRKSSWSITPPQPRGRLMCDFRVARIDRVLESCLGA